MRNNPSVSEAMRGISYLAVDTSALIDYAEERDRSIAALNRIFRRVTEGTLTLAGSVLLATEVLVVAQTEAERSSVEDYQNLLATIELYPVTAQIAAQAADYRMYYRLESMDALHLATAVSAGADALITADTDFLRAQGIPTGPGRTLRIIIAQNLTT